MTEITAQLNSYRQSPRKVRAVADVLHGKAVGEAQVRLSLITKRAIGPLAKLLNSAIANAKNMGLSAENLFVKSITVDGGKILYRRRPVSHGSAHPIHKRTSHVTVVLSERQKSETKKTKAKN